MKKCLCVATVLLTALFGLRCGALADADWNVLKFLDATKKPAAAALALPVNASATDDQVSIAVNSALYDGVRLAFDWTVANANPEKPVFLQLDDFSVNHVKVSSDGVDSFDGIWLDEDFDDGTFQDGEWIDLPSSIRGSVLHVSITMGVYRPKLPIYRMSPYDETLAKQKLADGYLVIPDGSGYVVSDPEEGLICIAQSGKNRYENLFDYHALTLTFDVDTKAGKAAAVKLVTEPSYTQGPYTAKFSKAVLTPLALYINMRVENAAPGASPLQISDFVLADAKGKPLVDQDSDGDSSVEITADGHEVTTVESQWLRLPDGVPPENFSIACVPQDGSKGFLMPISIGK